MSHINQKTFDIAFTNRIEEN